jgi:hypothetical protein
MALVVNVTMVGGYAALSRRRIGIDKQGTGGALVVNRSCARARALQRRMSRMSMSMRMSVSMKRDMKRPRQNEEQEQSSIISVGPARHA